MVRYINTSELPSKGLFGSKKVKLDPVKHGVLSANSDLPYDTPLERMWKDFQIYIKTIPEWESLCSYDFTALVFLKKAYTVGNGKLSSSFTVKCPYCTRNNVVRANLMEVLSFPTISDDFLQLESITLGETKLYKKIPNFKDMEESLSKMLQFKEKLDNSDIMMRLFFGFKDNPNGISNAIYNATGEDEALLTYITSLCDTNGVYNQGITCSSCKEVITVARSDFFATDPFWLIVQNFQIPKNKITFFGKVQ